MTDDHIVELYAAADSFEAERLRELLAEAGIQSTVVGEEINHVAGSMPYGGVASPRIWVHEQDETEAARFIQQWLADKGDSESLTADSDDTSLPSEVESETEQEPAPVEPEGVSILGKALMTLGLGCILMGAFFAWSNYQTAETYSGLTEAKRVEDEATLKAIEAIPRPAHLPVRIDAHYEYQVQGKGIIAQYSGASSVANLPLTTTVHFKPSNPSDCVFGELPSTWFPLLFGSFFGLLMMFIVYRLN